MSNGKVQKALGEEELGQLFVLVLAFTRGQATGPIWNALVSPDGSARDRAAGFVAAVLGAPGGVFDAGVRAKARKVLARLADGQADEPVEAGRKSGT